MTNLFPEIKSVETTMKQQASLLEKLEEQQQSLTQQLENDHQKFMKLKASVSPEKTRIGGCQDEFPEHCS